MTPEEEINHYEDQLMLAMKTSNVNLLEELLHVDLLFAIPSGETFTKKMDLESHRSGVFKLEELNHESREIALFEDSAVVSALAFLKGRYHDFPIEGKFKYIRTWKKYDSGWKVISGAGIQIQE